MSSEPGAGQQNTSNGTLALRNSLKASAVQIWNAKKQAELNGPALANHFSIKARLAGLAAVMALSFVLLNTIDWRSNQAVTKSDTKQPEITNSIGSNKPSQSPQPAPPARTNKEASPRVPESPPRASSSTGRVQPRLDTTSLIPLDVPPAKPKPTDIIPQRDQPTVTLRPEAPPVVQSLPAEAAPQSPALPERGPKESAAMEPLNREATLRFQARLRNLGFLSSAPTGVWDPSARDALRDFKVANRLAPDDVWDVQTSERLNSQVAIRADRSFIGNWTATPCGSRVTRYDPPLSINSRGAKSAAGDSCEFSSIQSDSSGWHVRAICTVGKETWNANYTFVLKANQLIWTDNGKVVATYFRCT